MDAIIPRPLSHDNLTFSFSLTLLNSCRKSRGLDDKDDEAARLVPSVWN